MITVKKLISSIVPSSLIQKMKVIRFYKNEINSEIWGGGTFKERFDAALKVFIPDEKSLSKAQRKTLMKNTIDAYLKFGATPAEYFLFEFSDKSDKERSAYLTDRIKDETALRTISLEKFRRDLTNKFNLYQRIKKYFQREAILVASPSDLEAFVSFVKKHGKVFAKPNKGSKGSGAQVIVKADDLEQKFSALLSEGEWIIEELVIQDPRMAAWNSSSVNTVRVPSIYSEGRSNILAPFFRSGRKGSVIDNAAKGGMIAPLDADTGMVIGEAFDEANRAYSSHPDSGLEFNGWSVPCWKELKEITQKIHSGVPDHKYLAFDFALTPKGWVVIECNWGQFVWQYATKIGVKDQFLELMNRP